MKNYHHPLIDDNESNTFFLLSWRPRRFYFRNFYAQNAPEGHCLYVNRAPYKMSQSETYILACLQFRFNFGSMLEWGLPNDSMIRLFGRFFESLVYDIPLSMLINAISQSTI